MPPPWVRGQITNASEEALGKKVIYADLTDTRFHNVPFLFLRTQMFPQAEQKHKQFPRGSIKFSDSDDSGSDWESYTRRTNAFRGSSEELEANLITVRPRILSPVEKIAAWACTNAISQTVMYRTYLTLRAHWKDTLQKFQCGDPSEGSRDRFASWQPGTAFHHFPHW